MKEQFFNTKKSCHAASKVGQKQDNGLKYLQILLSKRYYFIFMVFNLCKIPDSELNETLTLWASCSL